ncbi:leucine-rich repeat domain-containing protein [Noviherbaspirillum galbum]|uniref:F-box domain-containing protein n=1 Tax=Noviherbaspirillum galbum TaxID=2709383 RepID=A0A6B3SW21_9BURK|nr:hypothetical protein [Noviherbaspirillum galbum]NEX63116.1 hypothetical protein [Noviherbaspirillum galbum]
MTIHALSVSSHPLGRTPNDLQGDELTPEVAVQQGRVDAHRDTFRTGRIVDSACSIKWLAPQPTNIAIVQQVRAKRTSWNSLPGELQEKIIGNVADQSILLHLFVPLSRVSNSFRKMVGATIENAPERKKNLVAHQSDSVKQSINKLARSLTSTEFRPALRALLERNKNVAVRLDDLGSHDKRRIFLEVIAEVNRSRPFDSVHVDLDASNLGFDDILKVASHPAVTSLDLSSNRIDAGKAILLAQCLRARESRLESLTLNFNKIGAAGTTALSKLALDTLSLIYCDLDDSGASALANMQVRALRLDGNDIGLSGLNALSANQGIRQLGLAGIDLASAPDACTALSKMRLVDLNLCGGHIGNEGLKNLAQGELITSLKKVSLTSNELGPESVPRLRRFVRLESLRLCGNPLGNAAIGFVDMPLEEIDTYVCGLDDTVKQALEASPFIKQVRT